MEIFEGVVPHWLLEDLTEEEAEKGAALLEALREADRQVIDFEEAAVRLTEQNQEVPSSALLAAMRHYQRSQITRMQFYHHVAMAGQRSLLATVEALVAE